MTIRRNRKIQRLAPEERRSRLLVALKQAIQENGFFQTTVADVVKSAGVAQGTFYRYFEDLDDAFLQLLKQTINPLEEAAKQIETGRIKTSAELERRLDRFYRVLGEAIAHNGDFFRELVLAALGSRGAARTEITGFLERMIDFLRLFTEENTGHYPFRELDSDVIPGAVIGMVLGGVLTANVKAGTFDAGRWSREMTNFEMGGLTVATNNK